MRRTAVAFALLLSGCGSDEALDKAPGPRPATVMTFNVMCSICGSSDFDPWEKRLAYFGDIFERYDPDLVGIQELTPIGDEVAQVQAELSGHSAVGGSPRMVNTSQPRCRSAFALCRSTWVTPPGRAW